MIGVFSQAFAFVMVYASLQPSPSLSSPPAPLSPAPPAPPAPPGYSNMLFNGSPSGVPPKTDCTIRKAAWDYAKKLQPQKKGFKQVYNALQLQNCGIPSPKNDVNQVTNEEILVPSMLNAPLPTQGEEHVLYVTAPSPATRLAASQKRLLLRVHCKGLS
eukprot:gene10214-3047_t